MKKKFILLTVSMVLLTACSGKDKTQKDVTLKCNKQFNENEFNIKATYNYYFDSKTEKYISQNSNIEITTPSEDYAKAEMNNEDGICSKYVLDGECTVSRSGEVIKINVRKGVSPQFKDLKKKELQTIIETDKLVQCS